MEKPIRETHKLLDEPGRKISMGALICSARFTMAALSSALCYFNFGFMEPILAERLVEFNLNTIERGLFFAILPVLYIPATIMVQYVPQSIEKRFTIIVSAFGSGIAFLFVGPSELCDFPNSLVLMGIG